MTGHNSMKKKAGRPKSESIKGGIPEVKILGMKTTGPLPVNGGILRGKRGKKQ